MSEISMKGHWRVTLMAAAGAKRTRVLRYHEAEGTGLLEVARHFRDVVEGRTPAALAALTRVTFERIDAAGHVV